MPRKINPIVSMNILSPISQVAVETPGIAVPRMVERPVTPPVTKWFGTKKKYVEHAISTIPTFIYIQFLNLIITRLKKHRGI